MNQTLIKKLFIIFIFFNSIAPSSNKKSSKHKQRQPQMNTKQHTMTQQMQQQMMAQQQMQQPMTAQQQMQQPMQQPMMAQQPMQQPMPAMNNQIAPQTNTSNNLINMAENLYGNQLPTNITSNQISSNGMSMTIVQQLDPAKAAQLVADIHVLKKNFNTVSKILEKSIKINFYSDTMPSTETQQLRQEILKFTQNGMPIFDPKKQILSLTGELTNAPAPKPVAINPYTNTPVTLLDLSILQELRRLLINNIQNILFSIGEIDCHAWNVASMRQYMPGKAFEWIKQPQKNKAYNQNLVRDSWRTSIEYIANGKMKIKRK